MKTTESEMRAEQAPWPKSAEELSAYIASLVDREHDYGTCVYAMSLAAVAAYQYVCGKLGTTGFQAGCADLDILRRTRSIEGPFMIVTLEGALYPQSDTLRKVQSFIEKNRKWLAEEARKRIDERGTVHPNVLAHWMQLASNGHVEDADREYLELINGLDADRSESYITTHVETFLKYGIRSLHLYRDGDVAAADSVKDGCTHRLDMPVSLDFSRNIQGITVTWSVDCEHDGSNGSSTYNFNLPRLETLAAAAKPEVATGIRAYIERAKAATKPTA
jgi:hypothetical protein